MSKKRFWWQDLHCVEVSNPDLKFDGLRIVKELSADLADREELS